MRVSFILISTLVLSIFNASCGDGGGGGEDPTSTTVCGVDPVRVAARDRCQTDDSCPCGTFCDLGRCAAQCVTDADCGELVCSAAGRCASPADADGLRLPSQQTGGVVSFTSLRRNLDGETPVPIQARTGGEAVARARFEAFGGAQIRCPGATNWGAECEIEDADANSVVVIEARRTPSAEQAEAVDPDVIASLEVYTSLGRDSMSLFRPDQTIDGSTSAAPAAVISGRYEGSIRLAGVGTDRDLSKLSDPAGPINLPLTATVWGEDDSFVIEFDDAFNALSSRETFIGQMTLTSQDVETGAEVGTANFPIHPFVETSVAGRSTALLTQTQQAKVLAKNNPRTLSIELTQTYQGLGAGVAPAARWVVELARTEGARGLPPQLPSDATISGYDPADRLDAATPWEQAFARTVGGTVDRAAAMAWYEGGKPPLGMCDAETDSSVTAEAILDGLLTLDGRPVGPALVDNTPFFPLLSDALSGFGVGPTLSFPQQGLSGLQGGEMPCGFFNVNITVDIGSPLPGYQASADFCSELAAKTGCIVETIPDRNLNWSVDGTYTNLGGASGPAKATYLMGVNQVCRLPAAAPNCAESIYCMAPGSNATTAATYLADGFDEDPANLTRGGDFLCANSTRNAGIAFDSVDSELSVNQAVKDCLSELELVVDAPPSLGAYAAGFNALYPDAKCIEVGRLLTAVAAQTQALRGNPPSDSDAVAAGSAYSQRLLGRWLQLHGFIASEANQIDSVRGLFLPGTAGESNLIDGPESRAALLRGWNLILSQHVLYSLLNAPAATLNDPDYRHQRTGFDPTSPDDAAIPLPVIILDTLARQAQNLTQAMEQGIGMTEEERNAVVRDFTPRAVIAQAIVGDMNTRATDVSTFAERLRERATRGLSVRANAYSKAFVEGGLNGAQDQNLPLYFQTSTITGASGRFTAVSDFIAGSGPDSNAWAPAMVDRAKASLDDARQAFLDESDRKLETARYQRDVDQWAADVGADYNSKLWDFCGPIDGSPIDDPDFDASQCAISKTDPKCSVSLRDWYTSWTPDDLMARFCVNDAISRGNYDNALGFTDPTTKVFADACVLSNPDVAYPVSIQACAAESNALCLHCDADAAVPEVELSSTTLALLAETVGNREDVPSNLWDSQWSKCQSSFPLARRDVPSPSSPFEEPDCVSGSIGEGYLGVVSANLDLQEARAALDEHIEAYDIAMQSCILLRDSSNDTKSARDTHRENMQKLRIAKGVADSAAAAAAGVKDCMSTAAGSDKSNPFSVIFSASATGGACLAGAVETAATIASIGLGAEMERAQQAHDDNVADIEAKAAEQICYNDAKLELVGSTTASYALERASLDLKTAYANVSGLIATAQAVHSDGYAFIQESDLFRAPSASGDPWLNERISTYTRDFALARRATFLAVKAVEYEFQQNLGLRQDVLESTNPADLEAVLQELWQESGTRSIQGSRPTELSNVLSLRDDIFQFADRSDWPEGTRAQTPQERFHVLLTSERYAVYDENGQYEGQRIPFALAPLGALGRDAGGVAIYSENDCAERLWSINASLIGNELYRGSDTSFVRLDVLKRNTFYSQWCGEPPKNQPFQQATVRPTQNLFRVPGFGQEVGTEQGVDQSRDRFSRARIQAFFGVDRAALEDTQYANGETSELAARGLYGDYALFIPASLIARDSGDGLVLENVDDILLRLDYLSVAKP